MSKRSYILRYSLLIRRLRQNNFPSWKDIQRSIEKELEMMQFQDESIKPDFSKRTFDRDKADLREALGVQIEYSHTHKGYYIEANEYQNQSFERMVEAFDMFNALKLSQDVSPYIHLEQRRPQGTENLHGLLHAIKNQLEIRFTYAKFWEEEVTKRHVAPYGLKEFRNRWYILADDFKDGQIKTFALDRLSELDITNRKINLRKGFNVEEYFRYSFGVIGSEDEPEEVELTFTPFQGKYIRTLPLHPSQKTLIDDDVEFRVKLKLHTTYDFLMELLSFGDQVKVVSPGSLGERVREMHEKAAKR